MHAAIEPFSSLMQNGKNSFVYLWQIRYGNSSADMLEKNMSDWIRRGKPARKDVHVLSLQRLSQLPARSIVCRLDPIAV